MDSDSEILSENVSTDDGFYLDADGYFHSDSCVKNFFANVQHSGGVNDARFDAATVFLSATVLPDEFELRLQGLPEPLKSEERDAEGLLLDEPDEDELETEEAVAPGEESPAVEEPAPDAIEDGESAL